MINQQMGFPKWRPVLVLKISQRNLIFVGLISQSLLISFIRYGLIKGFLNGQGSV
jgi:hypothetical protein